MKNTKKNIIQEKSYSFALRILRLSKHLIKYEQEYILSKQVLRSGTSIGANIEEAIGGTTKKDFKYKLTIAYKEAREAHFWLRLLRDGKYIPQILAESMLYDCDELLKILGTIIKTTKQNIRNS